MKNLANTCSENDTELPNRHILSFQRVRPSLRLFLVFPFLGLHVSPFTLWVPTLHTEGLQQSEVSSVHSASLRLRWVFMCLPYMYVSGPPDIRLVRSRFFFGPRMNLNVCACRTDLGWFNVPFERRGTTT